MPFSHLHWSFTHSLKTNLLLILSTAAQNSVLHPAASIHMAAHSSATLKPFHGTVWTTLPPHTPAALPDPNMASQEVTSASCHHPIGPSLQARQRRVRAASQPGSLCTPTQPQGVIHYLNLHPWLQSTRHKKHGCSLTDATSYVRRDATPNPGWTGSQVGQRGT